VKQLLATTEKTPLIAKGGFFERGGKRNLRKTFFSVFPRTDRTNSLLIKLYSLLTPPFPKGGKGVGGKGGYYFKKD